MPPRTPSLFSDAHASLPAVPAQTIIAHCDGGARGNPGPAGYGAEITDAQGNVLAELSEFLGVRTNNFAEYSGLLATLQYALDHDYRSLRVISDSLLMVKQIQGAYKVKSPDLIQLWQEAKRRIAKLERFEITHALRHKNKSADRLANEAMDRGMKRNTAAEGRPVVTSPNPTLPSRAGVQSLPLRAVPYPDAKPAPPLPPSFITAPQLPPKLTRTSHEPIVLVPDPPVATPVAPAASPTPPHPTTLTMLRGFTRDGAVHLLGPDKLPDGIFVKIIPE